MVSLSETTIERTAMFEAGRAHADAGLAPAYRDPEYMAGYESSDVVLSVHPPVNETGSISVTFRPRDAKIVFRALAVLTGIDPGSEGYAMEAWHTLADAVIAQAYGKTAAEMLADLPDVARAEMNENEVREQFGLEAAGLPSWFFQIGGLVEQAIGDQRLIASTEGVTLQ